MPNATVSVVIPALNEELNLRHVLPAIPRDVYEVILVDGNSTDRTVEVARELIPNIRIVQQEGTGKGDALRCGFAAATGDIIVALDADGSTDPGEIPRYVHALLSGADFAKGSRFLHGGGTSDMPFHRRMGNAAFVHLVRRLHGGRYTDLCYGYNAFWRRHLPLLDLDGDGFEIETEMNIRALRAGLRVQEVPSFEDRRVMGVGNLRTFPDGWRVLRTIMRERGWSASAQAAAASSAEHYAAGDNGEHSAIPVNGGGYVGLAIGNGGGNGAIAEGDEFAAYTVANGDGNGQTHDGNGHAPSPADAYVARLHALLASADRDAIGRLCDELRAARDRGALIFFAGNGGSSATAAHWVNDLAKTTRRPGVPPMRVMNLTDNVPWFTALANDEGYERVFSGQLENLARPGDVLVVISASGNSPNILAALEVARQSGMVTLGLIGFDGGAALDQLDLAVWIQTEVGAYGLVETAHAAVADIVTAALASEQLPATTYP